MGAALLWLRLVPVLFDERGDLGGEGFVPGTEGFDLAL